MHEFLAWTLGSIGGVLFTFGMAGMWMHLAMIQRSVLFGGGSATGWLQPVLFLALAIAAWTAASFVWTTRPTPRAILPRRASKTLPRKRRL